MLSSKLVQVIKTHIAANPSSKYVLSNQDTQEPVSDRVIQKIFKFALDYAKINKKVGVHLLRHSFSTHLLERGENILVIKELLGHSDVNTTLKYLHISKNTINKAKSPIDDILQYFKIKYNSKISNNLKRNSEKMMYFNCCFFKKSLYYCTKEQKNKIKT